MKRTFVLVCLFFAGLTGSASAQTKQALTHELMWSFQRVGAPVPSPDGRWVVFTLNDVNYDSSKDVSDLWIVPVTLLAWVMAMRRHAAEASTPCGSRSFAIVWPLLRTPVATRASSSDPFGGFFTPLVAW